MNLTTLSTQELLAKLTALLERERHAVAETIALLIEVEERRVHLAEACPSLFDFCTRRLGFSEGAAFRRINAARLARRFPMILEMLAAGRIHLSALVRLRDYLDDENHGDLLNVAAGKSKRQLEQLLAVRFPRPDVDPTIRKLPQPVSLPTPPTTPQPSLETTPLLASTTPHAPSPRPTHEAIGSAVPSTRSPEVRGHAAASVVEPLSATRYKVQLTASAELRAKLETAARLMGRHTEKDIATVVDRALDLLIEDLEKKQLGKSERPRRRASARPGYVTREVRREVVARDGEQCAFIGESGERCTAREHLELDHIHPRARGGTSNAANVRLVCRAHNQYAAERIFGESYIAHRIHLRRQKRALGVQASCRQHQDRGRANAPELDAQKRRR